MPRQERPLDPDGTALYDFAAGLRRLRELAGSPTYRELSRRAHYSVAALSEAAGGRKLPSLAVTIAYATACGADTAAWEQRWRQVAAELTPPDQPDDDLPASDVPSPYVGLAAFQPEDADRFFGRETLVADLIRRIRADRLIGVFGASGSGKSSVLRAGVAATALTRGVFDTGPQPVVLLTPGPQPMRETAARLAELTGYPEESVLGDLTGAPDTLHTWIHKAMAGRPDDEDLLLIVDQFEETFTLCQDPAERAWFVEALVTAATAGTSRTRVVLGVRADFYGHCGHWPALVEALQDAQVLVPPMSTDQLRAAVTQPAVRVGCTVETALVSRLVADATGQPAALPLLSHVLLQVWRRRRGNTLTLAGYDAAGGLDHAVARTAETAYLGLDDAARSMARQILLRLIAAGEDAEITKRRIRRTELDEADPNTGIVLEALATARLITLDRDRVDIAHEALIRCWPRLRDWLDENREGLRLHRQLTDAAHTWETLGRDESALYRGVRLASADHWAARNDDLLTPRERQFLHASHSTQSRVDATARRHTRRFRQLAAVLAAVLLVSAGTVVLAVRAQRESDRARDHAVAEQVVAAANDLAHSDPRLAIQIRLAAYRLDPTAAAWEALRTSFLYPYATVDLGSDIVAAAFTPNSRTLVTGSATGAVMTWDVTDPRTPQRLATFPAHGSELRTLSVSADGRILATSAGTDGTVRLWDIGNPSFPAALATITGNHDWVTSVAFAPGVPLLATTGSDRTVRLWDVADPAHPAQLSSVAGGVEAPVDLAISADGRLLAVSGPDTELWDIHDPHRPARLGVTATRTSASTNSVAFSPDSRMFAAGSLDGTAQLWDVTDLRAPLSWFGVSIATPGTVGVQDVAFSRDGAWLMTASSSTGMDLWRVDDPRQPRAEGILIGHPPTRVRAVVVSPDGAGLAEVDANGTLRLQDIRQFGTREADAVVALICDHATPPMTETEWARYFPGLAFQPPCP